MLRLINNCCSIMLQVFHTLRLAEGQDVTAISLNQDNTNLLVSTADKQLIVFTDPAVSLSMEFFFFFFSFLYSLHRPI